MPRDGAQPHRTVASFCVSVAIAAASLLDHPPPRTLHLSCCVSLPASLTEGGFMHAARDARSIGPSHQALLLLCRFTILEGRSP
ncbi:hypothetical protein IE81DRAFT_198558 [Ceraceosorus guamensis]|uniref:Uncharacterized protein n=1 Tax=Ceraceosorus guamensis TaxID=1522189 RepID=A0A316VU65_9BASI|nr:hypothetical protein IE81DRAFT_198558 [Ceraceosorus guamensis]PWN40970.1 hypothetical protein IE81DRAFT_198558 [Ceraceosorus guamensis]